MGNWSESWDDVKRTVALRRGSKAWMFFWFTKWGLQRWHKKTSVWFWKPEGAGREEKNTRIAPHQVSMQAIQGNTSPWERNSCSLRPWSNTCLLPGITPAHWDLNTQINVCRFIITSVWGGIELQARTVPQGNNDIMLSITGKHWWDPVYVNAALCQHPFTWLSSSLDFILQVRKITAESTAQQRCVCVCVSGKYFYAMLYDLSPQCLYRLFCLFPCTQSRYLWRQAPPPQLFNTNYSSHNAPRPTWLSVACLCLCVCFCLWRVYVPL